MNLPRLAQRGRRKSKDLEDQAMDLMGSQLDKVFKMMDVSGDGQLDEAELKRAYELAGRPASDESIKKAIQLLDKDNDGLINLAAPDWRGDHECRVTLYKLIFFFSLLPQHRRTFFSLIKLIQ